MNYISIEFKLFILAKNKLYNIAKIADSFNIKILYNAFWYNHVCMMNLFALMNTMYGIICVSIFLFSFLVA